MRGGDTRDRSYAVDDVDNYEVAGRQGRASPAAAPSSDLVRMDGLEHVVQRVVSFDYSRSRRRSWGPSEGRIRDQAVEPQSTSRDLLLWTTRGMRTCPPCEKPLLQESRSHHAPLRVVGRSVAPDCVRDACQLASEGGDGDLRTSALGETGRPATHGVVGPTAQSGPGCLDQEPADRGRSRLGDGGDSFARGTRVLAGREAQVGGDVVCIREPVVAVECRGEA